MFILVFSLIYLFLLVLMSIVGLLWVFVVVEMSDVSMVDSILVDDICINYYSDFLGITDISDVVDTTDILDYVDCISFTNNIYITEEKCWLYQYFDDFLKLFKKDGNISIKPIYLPEDKLGFENYECKSISVYKDVLEYEVLRLSNLCDSVEEEGFMHFKNWIKCRDNIEVYKDNMLSLEIGNDILEENLSNLRVEYDLISRRYDALREAGRALTRDILNMSEEFRALQRENNWFRRNFDPQIYINLWSS